MKTKHLILFLLTLLLSLQLAPVRSAAQGWLELPGGDARGTRVTIPLSDGPGRSFTSLYDSELRISRWVAYPLNTGLIGEGTRGDGWHPAADLPESAQPSLYKGFAYGSGYDRGHQIPSADRLRSADNDNTFIFINATPQLHDFNGGIWAELEKVTRTWAKRSDTLYVVTGAVPGPDTIRDNVGNSVTIPSAYYKAVLRRSTDRQGRTRWSACAVLLPHRETYKGTWQENLALFRKHSLSIDELEKVTGIDFFPNASGVIGREAAESLEATAPADEPWWWK